MTERDSFSTISLTSSIASLIEERERRDLETGWQDLHKRIVDYRQVHKITIVHFLQFCELPDHNSFYQQLCGINGCNRHPTNKLGTKGKIFLDGVTNFFQKVDEGFIPPPCESDLENEIFDFQMDHSKELRGMSICNVLFKKEKNQVVIQILPGANEEEIKNFLKDKFHLEAIDIEFIRVELVYSASLFFDDYN